MRFSELKQKEVVNVLDGKRLGTIVDLEINVSDSTITAIIVPGAFSFRGMFKGEGGYVIPWQRICKVGDDVILVELDAVFFRAYE